MKEHENIRELLIPKIGLSATISSEVRQINNRPSTESFSKKYRPAIKMITATVKKILALLVLNFDFARFVFKCIQNE